MTNPYPGLANHSSNTQPGQQPIANGLEIPLPQPENKIALRSVDVTLKRVQGAWQLWCGQRMLRDFGEHEMDARDAFNVYRDSHLTEWVTIGGAKPIVEYGLANGRAPGAPIPPSGQDSGTPMNPGALPQGTMNFAGTAGSTNAPGMSTPAKFALPIDLKSVRVEAVRGVWCLRDDFNILLNFGPVKVDADQALAVVQHYGFNRLGMVGYPAPLMTYFYVGQDDGRQFDRGPFGKAALQAQIDGLARVGIPVPGVGYVGESVRFDPRKLEVRKEKGEWIVAGGTEVLGRYGQSEWGARDAARTLGDMRVTEFCKLGSAGMTFFLADGKAPTNVPFAVQGRRFNPNALRVLQYGNRCMVSENGRSLFDCANPQEGEVLIKVVKHFGFDQICRLGATGTAGVTFLAKGQ